MRCIVLVLMVLWTASVPANDTNMKQIAYRGGLVTFAIPRHWVEEYQPEGGGMFYEDALNTGTLRLNVITAQSPKLLTDDAAYIALIGMKTSKAASVQRLENGNALATGVEHTAEQGQKITIFWWHVANPVLPNHIRIANFTYTVLTSQEGNTRVQHEVAMLSESIKNARFHSTLNQ